MRPHPKSKNQNLVWCNSSSESEIFLNCFKNSEMFYRRHGWPTGAWVIVELLPETYKPAFVIIIVLMAFSMDGYTIL